MGSASLRFGDCRPRARPGAREVQTLNDNPPSNPRNIKGAKEIGIYLDDVYGRDMRQTIDFGFVDGSHLASIEGCQYPDRTHVIASTTAKLGPNGIVDQTIVQAWDS